MKINIFALDILHDNVNFEDIKVGCYFFDFLHCLENVHCM